ncbi:group III truncated hemoglobin [Pelagibacterium luteolum]|uniref:Hemoglobin n=1 Tax=Pelagibacterium luteolum TaxID=440168 RepID=A0A1G7XNV4_9HYPH|nr:group III truncated hemoglobin [Pelagibacterium luteolum]SDG85310.1 hemoglobin [Pelagibacterium luteolum]
MPLSELTLRTQVEQFYDRIRADELLAPIFAEHVRDWDTHVDRLSDFWSSIVLTSGRYKGNPYRAHLPFAHQLTPDLFARWLDLWSQTARDNFSEDIAAQLEFKAQRIARSLMAGLLSQPAPGAPLGASLPVHPGQH